LDAHRLDALRLDEALGHVQQRVSTDHVKGRVHRPGHAGTIPDRRSVYLSVAGEGAAEEHVIRPVLARRADRQQVPRIAGVRQEIHGHDATAVEKVTGIQLADSAAVAGRMAGRGHDRASIGEDDADHSVTERRGRVADSGDRQSYTWYGL